jgi:hypothetical protein
MLKHDQAEMIAATEARDSRSAVIVFEADDALRAICFHLVDDHHAVRVTALSVQHTRDRLRRQKLQLMIARRQWETLNNKERLEWLLGKSHLQAMYSGDVASLAPQK